MFQRILPAAATSKRPASQERRPDGKENQQPDGPSHARDASQHSKINTATAERQKLRPGAAVTLKRSTAPEPRGREQEAVVENGAMQRAFEKMLDELQIPSTLRPKLQGLETPVKAAMVRSNQVLTLTSTAGAEPTTPRGLRRSRSIDQLHSSPASPQLAAAAAREVPQLPHQYIETPATNSSRDSPYARYSHLRGLSLDMPRSSSHPEVSLNPKTEVVPTSLSLNGKLLKQKPKSSAEKEKAAAKDKEKEKWKDISPARFCTMLTSTSSTQLEVESVKKLRLMLRNESAAWSETFLSQGGYAALLARLNEILEVEWREEQHDDQILHELLRCFKALSTSEIGCFALRSSCPTPFVQLVSLLYSEKKPGDVCSRQLIVEILIILMGIYPSPTSPKSSHDPTLPAPHNTRFELLRALLLTPAPPKTESPANPVSPHAFIASLHTPRIYKTYLKELSDICRDYFWVFCHPHNTIWNLNHTDTDLVEKPKAPGGMTGGVEFEAMGYLTTHFKLINTIAKDAMDLGFPAHHEHSAYRLHSDLFASGIERIIMVARRASTAYYPTLHLEIARYVALAVHARFELPYTLSRAIGLPPAPLLKGVTPAMADALANCDFNNSPKRRSPQSAIQSQPSSPLRQTHHRPVSTPGQAPLHHLQPPQQGFGHPPEKRVSGPRLPPGAGAPVVQMPRIEPLQF